MQRLFRLLGGVQAALALTALACWVVLATVGGGRGPWLRVAVDSLRLASSAEAGDGTGAKKDIPFIDSGSLGEDAIYVDLTSVQTLHVIWINLLYGLALYGMGTLLAYRSGRDATTTTVPSLGSP